MPFRVRRLRLKPMSKPVAEVVRLRTHQHSRSLTTAATRFLNDFLSRSLRFSRRRRGFHLKEVEAGIDLGNACEAAILGQNAYRSRLAFPVPLALHGKQVS